MKLDITNAECIKEQYNLTNTTYYNICDGTQTVVGAGRADMIFGGILLVVLVFMVVFFYKVIKVI